MLTEINNEHIRAKIFVSDDGVLSYRIIDQTEDFRNLVKRDKGGYKIDGCSHSLRSNAKPFYNASKKAFYLRGWDVAQNDSIVSHECGSYEAGCKLAQELEQLLQAACEDDGADEGVVPAGHNDVAFTKGGTSHVRTALITKHQAEALSLTGKHFYPEERGWTKTAPIRTKNAHYNEHIGQVVDVLNKGFGFEKTKGVINPHKVTNEQARKAVEAVRALFDNAERDNYLVALWRTVTGLRGPDFVD